MARLERSDGSDDYYQSLLAYLPGVSHGPRRRAGLEVSMRRCRGAYYDKGTKVEVEGLFHQWASNYEDCGDAGIGNYTVALVELDDGRVVECLPDTVAFLDREGAASA